jgi:hypothetical protein
MCEWCNVKEVMKNWRTFISELLNNTYTCLKKPGEEPVMNPNNHDCRVNPRQWPLWKPWWCWRQWYMCTSDNQWTMNLSENSVAHQMTKRKPLYPNCKLRTPRQVVADTYTNKIHSRKRIIRHEFHEDVKTFCGHASS